MRGSLNRRKKYVGILLPLGALVVGGVPVVSAVVPTTRPTGRAAVWPMASHDASRTGTSRYRGPTTGRIRWKRQLEGVVTPGPAVAADGTIVAASNGGVLHGLDPSNGRDRWTFDGGGSYGNDLSSTPTILGDGRILWPGPGGRLFLLSPRGRLVKAYQLGGFVLSPVVNPSGTRVYAQDMGGALWAWDLDATGLRQRWSIDLGSSSYASPAIAPDGTLRTAVGTELVAVRDDGRQPTVRWRFSTGDLIEVSPAVGPDGTTVIGSNDPYEYAVNADGSLRWKYRKNSQTYGSPVVTADGRVVFGDHRGRVNTLDLATGREIAVALGEQKHSRSRSVGIWTSPAIDARGNIYVGTRLGHIYGFTRSGARLFDIDTRDTVDSYPALTADGALVIGSSNGMLYAVAD